MIIPDTEPNGVPWPKGRWDEVIPGLFQGGQIWEGPPGRKWSDWDAQRVKVREEFDAVFSFFWYDEPGQGPSSGVEHHHYPIQDGVLDDEELAEVRGYARVIARKVQAGDKVLVRCQAGYNRSGLVTAFALMELGYRAEDAVALIRKARGETALFRIVFLEYLKAAQEEIDAQPA
jgi:hypothetical protein